MDIETAPDEIGHGTVPQQAVPAGVLLDGEEVVATLDGDDGGRFVLTTMRVLHMGGAARPQRWSFAVIENVTGAELTSRPKDRSSLGWAILGFLGAIGIWQVSTNEIVGMVGGIVIGLIAAALAVDYLFLDPGSLLRFHAAAGDVSGPVRADSAAAALELADRLLALQAAKGRQASPARRLPRYPSG